MSGALGKIFIYDDALNLNGTRSIFCRVSCVLSRMREKEENFEVKDVLGM